MQNPLALSLLVSVASKLVATPGVNLYHTVFPNTWSPMAQSNGSPASVVADVMSTLAANGMLGIVIAAAKLSLGGGGVVTCAVVVNVTEVEPLRRSPQYLSVMARRSTRYETPGRSCEEGMNSIDSSFRNRIVPLTRSPVLATTCSKDEGLF